MDTTSTFSHIINSGSGTLLLILGGIAISIALTVSYRKSQSNRSGGQSTNIIIGGDMKSPINLKTPPEVKPKK